MAAYAESWLSQYIAAAGPSGLRAAGLSAHEVLAVHRAETTSAKAEIIGPDRVPYVLEAYLGVPLTERTRERFRLRTQWFLANAEFSADRFGAS